MVWLYLIPVTKVSRDTGLTQIITYCLGADQRKLRGIYLNKFNIKQAVLMKEMESSKEQTDFCAKALIQAMILFVSVNKNVAYNAFTCKV